MKITMIKKYDLADHLLCKERSSEILLCSVCDGEYSANFDDYWNMDDDKVFMHCEEPMQLCTKETKYNIIK